MPLFSRLVAARAILASSGELPSLPAMASAAPSPPRPHKRHGGDRLRLRSLPVSPVRRTVPRSAFLGNASELHVVAMAAPPSAPSTLASHPLSSPPSSNLHRSSQDQRLGLADTPSRVFLLKSPSASCISNPSSLAYSRNAHSHFENVVSSV
jgi:hypothetical protein